MTVTVIIPFRDNGDPCRQHNLLHVLAHLEDIGLDPYIAGDNNQTGPFNRSAAYNNGRHTHPADIYVFHEADILIPAHQLEQAITEAETPGLVVPFTDYHYMSAADTQQIYKGAKPFDMMPEYTMADGRSNGAINVVSETTMQLVGQWDTVLSGWGWDDRAMVTAFRIATGNPTRYIPGAAVHLWHTPGWSTESRFRGGADIPAHEQAATNANQQRYQKYRHAKTPERIRELTAGAD